MTRFGTRVFTPEEVDKIIEKSGLIVAKETADEEFQNDDELSPNFGRQTAAHITNDGPILIRIHCPRKFSNESIDSDVSKFTASTIGNDETHDVTHFK